MPAKTEGRRKVGFALRAVECHLNAVRFLMLNWRDPKNPLAGGAERVSLGYMRGLVERGHEVYWFTYDFPGGAKEEIIHGVKIVRGGGKGSSIVQARRWYQEQERFDLVIDQHHGIPWYAPWWCRTKCIAYIHEVLGPIWDAFYGWPLNAIGKAQERWTHWLYRNVAFWTVCESTREQLMRNGVKEVHVIPNGVATQAIAELPPKPFREPLRLAVVSRLAPNKRIDHAIRTMKELQTRGVQAELTVIGEGEMEQNLKGLVRELGLEGKVTFAGALPEAEKDALLRQSHLLLHTSQREGWGLNVIEANAMGTPAAVYPVPGLIDSTLDNHTGVVARGETPALLAGRVQELVRKPDFYQTLRTNAWQRAAEFHWSNVLPQALDWLEEMGRSGL